MSPKLPTRRVVVAVVAAVGCAALLMACRRATTEVVKAEQPSEPAAPSKELKEFSTQYMLSWKGEKPEFVIVFSGQQHNYEAPCGCTDPQYGGLERRYNLIQQVRGFGVPVGAADLGDIYYRLERIKFSEQARLKYFLSMRALDLMQYDAVAVGPEEFRIPLLDALAETVLNKKYSFDVLGTNIANKDAFPAENGSMLKDVRVVTRDGAKLKAGVAAVLSDSVIEEVKKIDNTVKFERDAVSAKSALASMKDPEIKILLYNGTAKEGAALAQQVSDYDLILCRSEESEPAREEAVKGTKTKLGFVGHKGRYVGLLAAFRGADGKLDLRWDLVRLGPELKTPAEQQAKHPIVQLLEGYTLKLKDDDFLGRVPKLVHPLAKDKNFEGLKYVGSDACNKCHQAEFATWQQTRHAGAYETLSDHPKAKPPSNRQYDPECVICHTVGFGYASGFRDNGTFPNKNPEKQKHLWGVGCEVCHGPGSLHAANPNIAAFLTTLSPWRENKGKKVYLVENAINEKATTEQKKEVTDEQQAVANGVFKLCFQCHDIDNDHDFQLSKWKKIAHGAGPTVKKK